MIHHVPIQSLDSRYCTCGGLVSEHPALVQAVSPLRDPVAHARRNDPDTSHAAAASVQHIRASQGEVLAVFRHGGPMTDEQAYAVYSGLQSVSGFRTRRSELVALGKLADTGQRVVGLTGRKMIVWGMPE